MTSELAECPPESTSNISAKTDDKGRPISNSHFGQYSVTINATPTSLASPNSTSKAKISSNSASSRRTELQRRNNRAAMEANTAAWSYTKCAVLFFISLLVTWVPSSVNRVYSLVYPELISIPFTYASAVVLPLMGFWNSVIYITTSWAACKMLFHSIFRGAQQQTTSARRLPRTITESRPGLGTRKSRANSITDSMRGLAVPYGV